MSGESIILLDTTVYVCTVHCVFQLIPIIYLCYENCIIFYIESIIHVCNDGIFNSPFIQWKVVSSSALSTWGDNSSKLQNMHKI